jgi:hypothetical protein
MKCEKKAKLAEEKQKKEFALQQKRNVEQQEHARRLGEIDEKIASENHALRDVQVAKERTKGVGETAPLSARALPVTNAIQNASVASPLQEAIETRPKTKSTSAQQASAKKLVQTRAEDAVAQDELKRRQEQEHLREYARTESGRIDAMLEGKRKEEARQNQQKAEAQAVLR